ncbi:MAG: hypothetical protein R8K46_10910 [Mariprofundaceae bacterium]
MHKSKAFTRGRELERWRLLLPAETYNRFRLLMRSNGHQELRVAFSCLQYEAVVRPDQIAFLSLGKYPRIELAWRNFRPQLRRGLFDPVSCDLVIYSASCREMVERIAFEFAFELKQRSRFAGRKVDVTNVVPIKAG